MVSSNPLSLMRPALLLCLFLAACGFEPMAAKHTSAQDPVIPAVEVGPVEGRTGQVFRNELENLLRAANLSPPVYVLNVRLSQSSFPAQISRDGSISRYNITVSSTYELIEIATGKQVAKGALSRISSFNNVANAYFSAYVAEQDGWQRLARELAEEYRLRLAAILNRLPSQKLEVNDVNVQEKESLQDNATPAQMQMEQMRREQLQRDLEMVR